MYISLNWLKEFVTIPKGVTPEELAKTLTIKTAETEGVKRGNEFLDNVLVGLVTEVKPHPNADKLRIAKVSLGPKKEALVVCGGQNLKEGMYIAYASVGCKVKWHGEGEPVTLQKATIKGVESEGMICASTEIGLDKPDSEGEHDILDLSQLKPTPGTKLTDLFGDDDSIIEFDNKSLTHRPDLWGHYGIAREIAAIYKQKLKPLNPKPALPTNGEKIKVDVQDYELCQRYCGVIIKNIKVQPSPKWMQQRLKAAGHKCYNNIVDVTNYISSELGQPLHAFDKSLIDGGIVVRTADKNEKIKALDGKEYKLNETMLVIADHKKPVAIAGVMGGANSEINESTTEIIIESATFNGASVRRTSSILGLRTESVQRFEKQLDPNLSHLAMLRAIELILKVSPGAKVAGPITDNKKFDEKPRKTILRLDRVNQKIGISISKKDVTEILKSLGFGVANAKTPAKNALEITIPSFRAQKDVSMEDDLVEEIARIYGYNEIPPVLPVLPTRLPITNEERTKKHGLRRFIAYGLGFDEISNYSFYSKQDLQNANLPEAGHIKIENYLSEDQTHMRFSLAPNMLKKVALNAKYETTFNIFEIGRTYKDLGNYFPLEEKQIMGVVAVSKDAKTSPYHEASFAAETILKFLKVPYYKIIKGSHLPYAHPSKSATILDQKGETLGSIYVLHPQAQKNFDLEKLQIAAFELNFSYLAKLKTTTQKFKELPKFPPITIDVSVLIDKTKEIAEIEKAIYTSDKHLITKVELFDLYEGQNLGPENVKTKKSVAFNVTLQSLDRTLTDDEMSQTQKKIFENLQKLGGLIRGL